MKEYQDKELICLCGNPFIWTSGEQVFMNDLLEKGKLDKKQSDGSMLPGSVIEPRRCKDCRMKKKQQRMEK